MPSGARSAPLVRRERPKYTPSVDLSSPVAAMLDQGGVSGNEIRLGPRRGEGGMSEPQKLKIEDVDPRRDSLQSFERWSNYMLVTTVAAVAWVASSKPDPSDDVATTLWSAAVWCLGISIVFGIFTLALVPLVAHAMGKDPKNEDSIYHIKVTFELFQLPIRAFLTQACRPQHALFIAGVILYCIWNAEHVWPAVIIPAMAGLYGVLSRPWCWVVWPWRRNRRECP